jgi:hypothetical protein
MDKATDPYKKAKEFVESSSQSCIYIFWNCSEASIRGMGMGPHTQVWRNFYNPGANQVVTSMTGSMIRFMEYTVSQHTQHHVDSTPFATASMYMSLEDVDWNIMIPANVTKTRTQNVIATFHLHVKTSQDARNEVGSFGNYLKTLPDHIQ